SIGLILAVQISSVPGRGEATSPPRARIRSETIPTSEIPATLCSVQRSEVRSVATSILGRLFLAPRMATSPRSGFPPRMLRRSAEVPWEAARLGVSICLHCPGGRARWSTEAIRTRRAGRDVYRSALLEEASLAPEKGRG